MKETDIQAQIKASVRLDRGYCHKLTNQFTVGIPDLLIALPPFAPCIIEVKDLKVCTPGFSRQLDVTPKQRYELRRISEVYHEFGACNPLPIFSGIFVHCYYNKGHWLTSLPWGSEHMSYALLLDGTRTRKREPSEYWPIRPLLEAIGVSKVWQ